MTRLAQDERDLRQDAAFQLEDREGVVLDIDVVGLAGLVDGAAAAPSCGGTTPP